MFFSTWHAPPRQPLWRSRQAGGAKLGVGCRARVTALEDANKQILEDQVAHAEALNLACEKLEALEQLEGTLEQQVCCSH